MLDSGASTSIISLDLARRLKLRVEPRGELLLNGIDGVKTKVTNKCQVKITLGHRVVYTLDIWVGNIGQGIDDLLGMNFMVAAGVRLCAHVEVVLPDEERILLVGGPKRSHRGRTIDVSIHESLWLGPGDSKYIPIRTSEPDLESMDVWVSRGDRWVTLVMFSAKRIPVAIRVVNISRKPAQVLPHTKVATLTDRDRLPLGTNFVRPGSYQYDEREFLVNENTRSPAAERRLDAEIRELERNAPPMVDRPMYPTPTRVLRRAPGIRTVAPGVPEAHPVSQSPEPSGDEQSRKSVPDFPCGNAISEANIEDAIVGEPGESDPAEKERLRAILRKHRMIFLGEGNTLPLPARGVVCDLDVGDEKPISMRSRRIPADLLSKVYELLKRLLETGLIEYSDSE
ncbi:hypothetical protein PHMEG_00022353 [Phytophthora megakarya]|uniref:Peptidase A2 domain-containing protein n=1 Tax=Phytophthora megakarya TaxID=4795 RepID=A0A225VJF3_9STRA|nr:hypothetical protein PHMEG_00022353 [Phytophthora megakarya]